jgi:hypothetical protein
MEEAIVKTTETEQEKAWALMQRQANCWASSDLVPTQYQGKIANVIIALEVAKQINVSPLAVMQNLYVVHGRPAFEAKFLIAAANSSGKFSPLRYRFEGVEGKQNWGCRAVAVDLESKEELVGPLITMKLAQDEGWTGKKGSKWQTMPELMLRYRAAAWWVRVYAPEISLGFQTAEEVVDVGPAQVVNVGPAQVVEVGPEESSLDAVTRQLKEKREAKAEPSAVDHLTDMMTQRYGDKADAVIDELLLGREKMREDLDEDLAKVLIADLEDPQ